jgi:hypothetical protein
MLKIDIIGDYDTEHFGLKHPSVWCNLGKKWIKICYCNSIINDSPVINFSSLVEKAKPLTILAIKFGYHYCHIRQQVTLLYGHYLKTLARFGDKKTEGSK